MENKKGICLFCEKSSTCTYSKSKDGVLECNEYEEIKNKPRKTKKEIKDGWVIINPETPIKKT